MTSKLERIANMERELAELKKQVEEENKQVELKPFDYTKHPDKNTYTIEAGWYTDDVIGSYSSSVYAPSETSAKNISKQLKLYRLLLDLKASLGDADYKFTEGRANYYVHYYGNSGWEDRELYHSNNVTVVYFSSQENAEAVAKYLNDNGVQPE